MFAELTTDELRAMVDRAYREAARDWHDARAYGGDDDNVRMALFSAAQSAQDHWAKLNAELHQREDDHA